MPALLKYEQTDADVECVVAGDELRISFRALRGAVFHSIESMGDELVAKAIPVGIAVTLSGLGMADKAVVGADRIVIGTDHPFDMGPTDPMAAIDAIPNLTAGEREWVCTLTARSLLGEDRSAPLSHSGPFCRVS